MIALFVVSIAKKNLIHDIGVHHIIVNMNKTVRDGQMVRVRLNGTHILTHTPVLYSVDVSSEEGGGTLLYINVTDVLVLHAFTHAYVCMHNNSHMHMHVCLCW